MEEEETEAKARFYNSLADLLDLIHSKVEEDTLWININIEKEE